MSVNFKRMALLVLSAFILLIQSNPVLAQMDKVAKNGDVVEIHYVGKLKDDTVFDKSEGREPLKFTIGSRNIIKGMSDAVVGMSVGQKKTVTIPSMEAYGPYNDKLVFSIPTNKLPPGVKSGDRLTNPQGSTVLVKEIKEGQAFLDANHFLAGKDLVFDISLLTIK